MENYREKRLLQLLAAMVFLLGFVACGLAPQKVPVITKPLEANLQIESPDFSVLMGKELILFDIEGQIEKYDFETGQSEIVGELPKISLSSTITQINEQEILIIGSSGNTDKSFAKVFNINTGKYRDVPPPVQPRDSHTATLLSDGRVLIAGGLSVGKRDSIRSIEVYDPKTNRFSEGPAFDIPRVYHSAELLKDGRVVFIGGMYEADRSRCIEPGVDIYNPETNELESAGNLKVNRAMLTTQVLPEGKVLVVAGENMSCEWMRQNPNNRTRQETTLEIYDPMEKTSILLDKPLEYAVQVSAISSPIGVVRQEGSVYISIPTIRPHWWKQYQDRLMYHPDPPSFFRPPPSNFYRDSNYIYQFSDGQLSLRGKSNCSHVDSSYQSFERLFFVNNSLVMAGWPGEACKKSGFMEYAIFSKGSML